MAEDQQVKFTIVIDKNTGAVKQVASDLGEVASKADKVGKTSKEATDAGTDGFKKLNSKVGEFAMGMLVAQLALEGIKKVAAQNDDFQVLQQTFADTAKVLFEALGPGISMISKGLSGVLVIIGSLAKGVTQMVKGEWSAAMDTMAAGVERAAGIIEGHVKVITKNMQEAATARLEQEQQHAQAVAQLQIADADRRLQGLHLTEEQRLAIMEEKHQAELNGLNKAEKAKQEALALQLEGNVITQQAYEAKLTAMKQQASDARKAIDLKAKTAAEAVEREKTQKLEGFFKQQISAGKNAAVARYEQTQDTAQAIKAGAGAEVSALADYAGEYIMIEGAKAAASVFRSTAASIPGPGGLVAGAAAAAGTLAFFTGLAAVVGVAGNALGGAIAGTGGGGGGEGNGTASDAGTASGGGGGDFAGAPTGGSVSGPGASGGQGGLGAGVTVLVYLDGDVLFRAITNASRDGRITITARNVVP